MQDTRRNRDSETVASDRNKDKCRKKSERENRDSNTTITDKVRDKTRKQSSREKRNISVFKDSKKEFASYICTCCNMTWLKSSVIQAVMKNFSKTKTDILSKAFTSYKSFDGI